MIWFRLLLLPLLVFAAGQAPPPPTQPIAFSHAQHAGKMAIKCQSCHTNPKPGEMMTFPAEQTCMGCHQAIKKDSEQIQLLAKFAADKKRVPWVRVYQVPGYVFWSHRSHLEAKLSCSECHGEVSTMEVMFKAKETNMGSCMSCHARMQVSNDCSFCHERD
ncbi:MAG: cytochrome c3 family protein [Bryobacter sp.]